MQLNWVLDIKERCEEQGIAFFFKQWGGVNKKRSGRLLQGKLWDSYPATTGIPGYEPLFTG